MTTFAPISPEDWDSVLAVLEAEEESQRRQGHPNMVRGIQAAIRRIEVLRPVERSKEYKFQHLTSEEISALSIGDLELPDQARSALRWYAKIETIADLEKITWRDLLKIEYVGLRTVQHAAAALEQAGTGFKPCDKPVPSKFR